MVVSLIPTSVIIFPLYSSVPNRILCVHLLVGYALINSSCVADLYPILLNKVVLVSVGVPSPVPNTILLKYVLKLHNLSYILSTTIFSACPLCSTSPVSAFLTTISNLLCILTPVSTFIYNQLLYGFISPTSCNNTVTAIGATVI